MTKKRQKTQEHDRIIANSLLGKIVSLYKTSDRPTSEVLSQIVDVWVRKNLSAGNNISLSQVHSWPSRQQREKGNNKNIQTQAEFSETLLLVQCVRDCFLCLICKQVSCDIPGLCQQEYFSYICFHISTNVLDIS